MNNRVELINTEKFRKVDATQKEVELNYIITTLNQEITSAVINKRNELTSQFKTNDETVVSEMFNIIKNQGYSVEEFKPNEIPTITGKIIIVDIKISW